MQRFLIIASKFEICNQPGLLKAFQILGYALNIVKIVAPLLLIVVGSVELGKAVLSNDEKAIKVAVNSLIKKAIAAVVIFFLPFLIKFVVSLIDGIDKVKQFDCLTQCLNDPSVCNVNDPNGLFTN